MKKNKHNSKRPKGTQGNQNPSPRRLTVASGDGQATTPRSSFPKSEPKVETAPEETTTPPESAERRFPIVGIGASAGGLAAFEDLFAHMPPDGANGISFVIVQHLDPDHKSILTELVRRCTRMRVSEAADDVAVQPNCAYIIPPNKDLALSEGKLHLMEPGARRGLRLPIDFFFRSLAKDRGEDAIGIILSGNGTDGTLGLRAIKEAGGMAIVQDPQSAEYDGMPRSAIASGLADYVLPPDEMPSQLIEYVKRASNFHPGRAAPLSDISSWVLKIMALLRSHSGHDFSNYKHNTIRRRVERRMTVNHIESLDNYVRMLRQTPGELDILFRELLIGVTGFFRDSAAFDVVRDLAIPPLMNERPSGVPIRIWVPACSTGEEAYSLAMLFHEAAEKLGREFVVQVFATDIDEDAIDKARAALYPASIAADVSPERLSRFFTHEDKDFYRIKKTLRDQVIFAVQDVIKDPPFSKIDLISCRNMLIYMEPVLQKRLLPLFHYALASGGFLLLGNSESVGEFTNFFAVVERKWKLYRRRELTAGALAPLNLSGLGSSRGHHHRPAGTVDPKQRKHSLRELTEHLLLRNYAPACVAVNDQGDILYVHGRSGKYLELPAGDASLNLVRAAREGLKIELSNGLRKVLSQRKPVAYQRLEVRTNGGFEPVDVTMELAEAPPVGSDLIIVTFRDSLPKAVEPRPPAGAKKGHPEASEPPDEKDRHITNLERELRMKSETLQTTIEELETSNEELKSTNEELQSTNEELQSTNEELETSKEELQSVNEELVTVNSELQQKMEGLSRANNDMNNLLAGTGIGMLFVDHQLHIQRFTPATTQIIKLIQTDLGRPVSDLVSNLEGYDRLAQEVKAVLDTLIPREAEVHTREGHWYLMRILPYRTVENVIEGAVLTFVDIAAQKRAEEQFRTLSSDLEKRVHDRVAELERLNQEFKRELQQRREAEARRVTDIAALTRLHDLALEQTGDGAHQKLLQAALDAAIELTHADMGTLQLYEQKNKALRLVAHRGFEPAFVERFSTVGPEDKMSCAEALKQGKAVVVEDIATSKILKGSPALPALQAAGIRAVQSTPVHARDGGILAMFSTHWKKPLKVDEGTLRLLELLARQLADLIENSKASTGADHAGKAKA